MKYVMFVMKCGNGKQYMPVICPDNVSHSQVKLEGCEAVSAGFLTTFGADVADVWGESTSMGGLQSIPEVDKSLLQSVLDDTGTMAFVDIPIDDVLEEMQKEAACEMERLKDDGWTKADFAKGLKECLDERPVKGKWQQVGHKVDVDDDILQAVNPIKRMREQGAQFGIDDSNFESWEDYGKAIDLHKQSVVYPRWVCTRYNSEDVNETRWTLQGLRGYLDNGKWHHGKGAVDDVAFIKPQLSAERRIRWIAVVKENPPRPQKEFSTFFAARAWCAEEVLAAPLEVSRNIRIVTDLPQDELELGRFDYEIH